MGDSVTEENSAAENQSEVSSENESSEGKTKSGTASPENTSQSGTESENSGLAEEESSGEENPDLVGPMIPSHSISNSLMASVAEYYAAGNWIPDLSFALPADFTEKILGENLSDYWGMETWADSDRKNFVDTIIGGWKERLDKENSAVG